MRILAAVFALLVAAAGWYYLFYSRAAQRLADVEGQRLNQRRVRLRKIAGFVMMLLAICFFTLFWTFEPGAAFVVMALAVFLLLAAIIVLAMIDLRLTWQLRNRKRDDLP